MQASESGCVAVCGDMRYKVTVCFPGSMEIASCSYSVNQNFTYGPITALGPSVVQLPCPRTPIFGQSCEFLPGTLYIAFGPCNSGDEVPIATPENTLPVETWLQKIGLDQVQVGIHYHAGLNLSGRLVGSR
jgi:hypothetical protein